MMATLRRFDWGTTLADRLVGKVGFAVKRGAIMAEQIKAVALISGGLDSMLAAKVVMQQGVHVEGINFFTGFCVEGHTHAIRAKDRAKPKRNNALWVAEQLGIKLHIIDVIDEYKDVLLNPKHGYGQHLNPCLDCKIFMVKKALAWGFMEEHGFDFIVTGEVIGQRPKSQRKETMPLIARESGADDRLLRPLCAKNLPATLPEREGWVQRDALFDFHGRSRKPQIQLAESFGFTDWAQPAGGCCFLTDEHYAQKLSDLWRTRGTREYELDDIMLLKVGRHIRPAPNFKLIVGREDGENNYLQGYKHQFTTLRSISHNGPLCLIDGTPSDADVELGARVVARYGQGRNADQVIVVAEQPNGVAQELAVVPLPPTEIPASWHV
jgi:tRNA U34 2-thiouridine synthase MnmA/TrmU